MAYRTYKKQILLCILLNGSVKLSTVRIDPQPSMHLTWDGAHFACIVVTFILTRWCINIKHTSTFVTLPLDAASSS